MPYISVQCTHCGGDIQLDDQKEFGYCLYCGSKVIYDESIVRIENYNSLKVENLAKIAFDAYQDKNYHEAIEYFNRTLEIDTEHPQVMLYKGLAKASLSSVEKNYFSDALNGLQRTQKIIGAKNRNEVFEFSYLAIIEINKIIINYHKHVKEYYIQNWKSEKSPIIFRNNISYCIRATEECIEILNNLEAVNQEDTIRLNELHIRLIKNLLIYLSEYCKKRNFVESVGSFGENIKESPIKSGIKIEMLSKFDEYSNRLMTLDSNQETPTIDRSIENKNCYIATAIYGNTEANEVVVLRRFRDKYLAENLFGRLFIRLYYQYSPLMASRINTDSITGGLLRISLDKLVGYIRKKGTL